MFGFLLLVSCMCAAPQDGSTSFAARRSGQQLQRSSGHRIDEFRPVGFRTRFEGPSPNQQATRESCSRCCRKDPEVAGGNSNSGKFQGGQTSPGSLHVAQARASVPQSKERVDSCKLFLTCQGSAVQRAQEVIDRACEQKVLYEAEVVEG